MRYKNAAEILPDSLLRELQTYISGDILYIPKADSRKEWGSVSGSKEYYLERNQMIKKRFRAGDSIEQLSMQYGLAYNTIKKIIYQ